MKVEGVCGHCQKLVSVVFQLPVTWGELEGALMDAHDKVDSKCGDGWILDGLCNAPITSTANPNICRHAAEGCECYLRCSCGWLVPSGARCPNPNHVTMATRKL